MGGVEIRIDRARALDLDERPFLHRAASRGDVEETLTVSTRELGVRGGEPRIGGHGALEEVDRLRDLLGTLHAGMKSAAEIEIVGPRIRSGRAGQPPTFFGAP